MWWFYRKKSYCFCLRIVLHCIIYCILLLFCFIVSNIREMYIIAQSIVIKATNKPTAYEIHIFPFSLSRAHQWRVFVSQYVFSFFFLLFSFLTFSFLSFSFLLFFLFLFFSFPFFRFYFLPLPPSNRKRLHLWVEVQCLTAIDVMGRYFD